MITVAPQRLASGDGAGGPRPALSYMVLHDAIARLAKTPVEQRVGLGLELLRKHTRAAGAYFIRAGEADWTHRTGSQEPAALNAVRGAVEKAWQEKRSRIDGPIVTCPIVDEGGVTGCLALLLTAETPDREAALQTLQWFSLLVHGQETEKRHASELAQAQRLAGFLELVEDCAGADDFAEAASRAAERLRELTGCDRVALAAKRWGRLRVVAVSGFHAQEATRGEGLLALEGIITEAVQGERDIAGGKDQASVLPSAAEDLLRQRFAPGYFWGSPLRERGKKSACGGWLFLWNDEPAGREETQRLLRAMEPVVAGQIGLWAQGKGIPGAGAVKRFWRKATATQRKAVLIAASALAAILLAPIPIPVAAPCELEPAIRRTVSAPFDGVLRQVLVEPGQTVEPGQILAEFDDREIRWELAEVAAKQARAEKQADSAESQGKIAEARMARLEAAGFQETAKVLQHRQAYLQVKAPIAGRVLKGDLEGSIGSRLRMGDSLFEIGPLDSMRVEIAVPEAEIGLVREGTAADFKFEALAGKSWDAKLSMVSPRSELRDGANVFICEAVIPNPDQVLRPGSQGRAKLSGPWRPVIWTMARPAWHWLRMKLW